MEAVKPAFQSEIVDTIVAPATPVGRSALALIRISGPKAFSILQTALNGQKLPPFRESRYRKLYSCTGELLDEVMLVCFSAPNSYTGEDVVEISTHGNPIIISAILEDFVSCGTRMAEAGEFTRRALVNSKMSVSEAESLFWILSGRAKESVKLGLQAKLGGLGFQIKSFRDDLLQLHADFEANLDFQEFEDTKPLDQGFIDRLQIAEDTLAQWVKSFERNKKNLDARSVCFIGPPNSGKSSLFNALLEEDRAITFDEPGTTRDLIEAFRELNGLDLRFMDTAGIRESADPIEQAGMEKAQEVVRTADLICWVSDQGIKPPPELLKKAEPSQWLFISSKSDLEKTKEMPGSLKVSVKNGEGLGELREKVFQKDDEVEFTTGYLTSDRQKDLCLQAKEKLYQARKALESGDYFELAAEHLREATKLLGEILGEIPTDEVIGSILSRFCIGK